MDRARELNIAHPLTSINWRKTSPLPATLGRTVLGLYSQYVVIGQEVFVMGWIRGASDDPVLVYDIARDSWDIHSWSPTRCAALTSYHSQLVLIGGLEKDDRITNKVLVYKEKKWHPSLPAMTVARQAASAVSSGRHIIVAGGEVASPYSLTVPGTDVMEVFDGHSWAKAQPLPKASWDMRTVLHEDVCYLSFGDRKHGREVFRATEQSIVGSTQSPTLSPVWTKLPPLPDNYCSIVVAGQQLLAMGGPSSNGKPSIPAISAYFPHTQSWVHLDDISFPSSSFYLSNCVLTLPTGDLMAVSGDMAWIGQLQAHPYHPESRFSISAIERLSSVMRVDMWQEIEQHHSEFITATQIDEFWSDLLVPTGKELVHDWLNGCSPLAPSWMNLLTAMKSSGLREVSCAIEKFLYTVPPTAAIPLEGAGEGIGTRRGTQSREQGVQTQEDRAVKSELEGGGAAVKIEVKSETVEHHMTAGEETGVKREAKTQVKGVEQYPGTMVKEEDESEVVDGYFSEGNMMLEEPKEEEKEEVDGWETDEEDEKVEEDESEGAWSEEMSVEEEGKLKHIDEEKPEPKEKIVPIRGADIIAATTLEVAPGKPLTFNWQGHGLSLKIPEDALKPNTPTQTMSIQASLSGRFQLPDDTELVSGVYWVAFPQRFCRPIFLELQHCAFLEHPDQLFSLCFLTARCNQETLPYQFKLLPGGVFSTDSSYGTIELSHFSGVGVGRRKGKGKGMGREKEGEEGKEKRYSAHTFYIPQAATTWLMHFTIVCDLELCLKKVEAFYSRKGAEAGPYLRVTFDGDEVSLDIPKEGISLASGWSLLPLVYPTKLLRKDVDDYQPGHTIPSCQVELDWVREEERPKKLSHLLHVSGVRPSETYIRISRTPTQPGVESGSGMEIKKAEGGEASSSERWRSQLHAGRKRRSEHEDTSQPAKREKLDDFLVNLMSALYHTVANKWKMIGVRLKLPLSSLNNIATKHQLDPQLCLMEMLEQWLKRVDPPPSWSAVIEAVRFLGEGKLALELTEKYLSQ